MARYYGTVRGNKGGAHRLGHTELKTTAATWDFHVEVKFDVVDMDTDTEATHVTVCLRLLPSETLLTLFSGKIDSDTVESIKQGNFDQLTYYTELPNRNFSKEHHEKFSA